ncbi:MAG: pyridoxal phosphate-dependent aminotransferase, partial [Candidatus Zixiibacteriota bacterium]
PSPCWVSYVPQARMLGRKVSLIQTSFEDRWRITAERLEQRISQERDQYRPRILILNYPGNPEGCSYSDNELKDLAEVARKFQVILLSDEIYGQLHFAGEHVSVARYYPERTIISSGLSKWCGAGGWRLGTFTFPRDLAWLLEAMAVAASETFTSVCAPIQCASVTAFQGGPEIERYLAHARRILRVLGWRCTRILQDGHVRVHPPTGGFYLFLDFTPLADKFAARGISEGAALCECLLEETGVAILPGEAFGRPSAELTARMAYVDFDGAGALRASEEIGLDDDLTSDFCERHCGRVVEAMSRIVEWVNR